MSSEKRITDLETKLQIALKALQFYANPESYGQGESFAELSRISDSDLEHKPANRGYDTVGGKTARRAIAEIHDELEQERGKKVKKAAVWRKSDETHENYLSLRLEFQDSSKEWVTLLPVQALQPGEPEFISQEKVSN